MYIFKMKDKISCHFTLKLLIVPVSEEKSGAYHSLGFRCSYDYSFLNVHRTITSLLSS